jgi:hypothetical protein
MIPGLKALMLTLIPKFRLPGGEKAEVVFIVDHSGSMSSHIDPLKSSLHIFLKLLALDTNFNICSFGSCISFLWGQSQSLHLPLACNIKMNQGSHHDLTGALLCPAGMDWANPECAYAFSISVPADADFACRIKVQLQSGEIMVSSNQWPVFIYTGSKFDPEDPWKGMFRSAILFSTS